MLKQLPNYIHSNQYLELYYSSGPTNLIIFFILYQVSGIFIGEEGNYNCPSPWCDAKKWPLQIKYLTQNAVS